jgi:hypothetical protein
MKCIIYITFIIFLYLKDTEFPGIVFPLNQNSQFTSKNLHSHMNNPILNPTINPDKNKSILSGVDANYRNIKFNVDNLKVIQIGITLANQYGEFPDDISTWQFNFKFDLE